ncbi:MAG TPA: PEP/pyruvate-binding domain-containing protein [Acidimicrobiales bacterium]|nr:PEP/pyruvate-binding domain-containing protein [Acidimicrobiales bacterium]
MKEGLIGDAPSAETTRPFVVDLSEEVAQDPSLTGGKSAALARGATADLDTLPGVVLTTAFCDAIDGGADVAQHAAVKEAYERAGGNQQALVARSSSVVEDTAESSMAGQFESVIGISGFDEFLTAVTAVLESRRRAGAADQPIAVLVQPLIEPLFGGVMFGVDPVSGRTDRRIVSAVQGGPEPLVSGEVDGSRYVLEPTAGKVIEFAANDGPKLPRADLRRLMALSTSVAKVFGGPQDVEWAIGTDKRLWLLQSRPVTSEIRGAPRGPIYGPGPVAETFPAPLTELEHDLWIPPLREAVTQAVILAGTATQADLDASDVVVCVDGHVAIDLRLAGEIKPKRTIMHRLNPIPAARELRGSWRVGRLRGALPRLAEHLLDRTDADLEAVPPLTDITSRQLIALLHRSRAILRALHAHEILMGMLTDTGGNRMTGASVALRVLAEARQDGLSDKEIIARSPSVLALTGPRVAPAPELPEEAMAVYTGTSCQACSDNGILREALRLRVRWVQEVSGRAAWELGERLAAAGDLTEPELIRHMTLEHVEAVATKRAVVVPALVLSHDHDFGAPLPAWFQLSDLGRPIRAQCAFEVGGGTGAGGGSGSGPVTYDHDDPPTGSVLVTTTLSPGLGPLLSRLKGIVAETGSVLSHLAILAREAGVPTVVGYAGAKEDLPEGAVVLVDGDSGRVTIQERTVTDPAEEPDPGSNEGEPEAGRNPTGPPPVEEKDTAS